VGCSIGHKKRENRLIWELQVESKGISESGARYSHL
jgi:hypothetical protein